ncbi:MAG: molecular chaperone HtpG [Chitinispirillaceae bacterium]|nr:molecular chaperone HtpG [Chitinispirillaceae bacterium]
MSQAAESSRQSLTFQTEAMQILNLMIHSLYTHKEVFLRELISNASDALDRLRFEALTDSSLMGSETDLAIRIKLDNKAKTITISDNGIGMSRQEVIDNIGTIARSGSKAFLEKLTGDQKTDSNLIGQFGVGFYSVFMVAARVKLVTKRAGLEESAIVWESTGEKEYSLEETTKAGRGTEITVYLKEDASEYAQYWNIKSLIKKYSDFIAFPIYLPDEKGKDEIINQTKPIWLRSASEVTKEQYEEFYQQALAGFDKPLATIHGKAEGVAEYSSLLYIPTSSPFDLFSLERKHGVKLYVKRVFIMDNCKELLPEYLRFVKGVVDSEDLPLNVSREILQQNPLVERIRKALVSKILSRLADMAQNEPDTYKTFWKTYGPVIKEGVHTDPENKEKLLELLRFQSSLGTKEDYISLKHYVGRMRQDQKEIYYIGGDSREIVEKSPHLEIFKAKSIEVLYMLDPIDEWIVPDIYTYDGKKFKSVTQGDLDLGDLVKEEKDAQKKAESAYKKFSERVKNILADSVKDVRITTRLKDSPACLVSEENAMGSHMEKIMKAMGQEVPVAKRILEINGDHPIIANLNTRYQKDPKDSELEEWVRLVYEQALIAEGQMVPDPLAYSKRVNSLLIKASAG